ncbi:MAG: cell division protein ZapA [Peptostreptococcaceae bacterium]
MNKVMVKINGSEYPMVGDKSEQHMMAVASYVDKEMSKVIESNPRLSSSVSAIVTAVNITDILFECSESNDELVNENEELRKKVGSTDEELKLEIRKLQLKLQSKDIEKVDSEEKIEKLAKLLESQKSEILELENKVEFSKEQLNSYKIQIEELKAEYEEADERAKIAESLASEFQNKAYKVQLEKTELENEVKYMRAMR